MAVAFHLPILQYDVRVPVSLFSPLFLASALTLFIAEGACKVLNRYYVFHLGIRQHSLEVIQNAFIVSLACCLVYSQCGSVSNEGLQTQWTTIIAEKLASASTKTEESLGANGIDNMCVFLFSGHVNSRYAHLPMVLVLWVTAISALVVNYIVERISGVRGMFSDPGSIAVLNKEELPQAIADAVAGPDALNRQSSSDSVDQPQHSPDDHRAREKHASHLASDSSKVYVGGSTQARTTFAALRMQASPQTPMEESPGIAASALSSNFFGISAALTNSYKHQLKKIRPILFKDMMDPPMLEMVPWYALLTSFTGVDMLIHLKLFVGRFDMRTLQAVTPNSFHYTPPLYPGHPLTGGGFTSSNSLNGLGAPNSLNLAAMSSAASSSSTYHSAGVSLVGSGFTSAEQSAESSPTGTPRAQNRRVNGGNGGTSGSAPMPTAFQSAHHVHQHHLDAPLVYDHCAEDEELWFDWMSDCGDGWNPSYQIARVLAKPVLNVSVRRKGGRKAGALRLPRAKMLVIGGDLAYPSPSANTYETRFFRPFQCGQ